MAGHASSPRCAYADGPDEGPPRDGASDLADDAVPAAGDEYADTDPGALTDFQSTLDPHGAWSDDPTYGTVWTPSADEVGADFSPYLSGGHWAYDDDYVWISDYAWGWAPFHYGRWVWLRERGWAWIPGRLYANAWVSWRIGDDATTYVGWAPAQPTWGWRDGIAASFGFASWEPFVFCPSREVFAPTLAPHVVTGPPAAAVLARTRPYVRATPMVGSPAPPPGPPPALLGINDAQVTRIVRTDPAVLRARQFAHPSSAAALGARAPARDPRVVRPRMAPRPSLAPRLPQATRRK